MTSPLRRSRYLDGDSDSVAAVDNLLGSFNDWRSVPEVIRLSIKALADVSRVQAAALKDMERQLNSKASKVEFASALSQKASLADFSQRTQELTSSLQSKVGLMDIQAMLEDKVSRSEHQYLTKSNASVEEIRRAMDLKANSRDLEAELKALQQSISELAGEVNRRSTNFAHHSDLVILQRAVDLRANETNGLLIDLKAQLTDGLLRKVSLADMDKLLASKADAVRPR